MSKVFRFPVVLFVLAIVFSLSTEVKASSRPTPPFTEPGPNAGSCHICAACAGLCSKPDLPLGIRFDPGVCALIYCVYPTEIGFPQMDIWRKTLIASPVALTSSPVVLTPALKLQLQEVGKTSNRLYVSAGMMEGSVLPGDFDYALSTWRALRRQYPWILDYSAFGGFSGNEKNA